MHGLYGDQLVTILQDGGYSPTLLTVPRGEKAKTWPVAQRLARELLVRGADRSSPLIALGGGVVGDLTGFLASIFMRGVPFLQVPTTLLAMVDAAIGGKTAINLPEGKNLLGTFHQPRLVAIDPQFLRTLPPSQRRNGLAEVLKAGFIRDPELLTRLDKEAKRIFKDEEELTAIIHRAAAIKAEVVAADEREGGLRRILNFGHTLGHGLEQASRFRLAHGEAVAWGMLAALGLSENLAGLPQEEGTWGRQLIKNFGLARFLPRLDPQAVLSALTLDKKRQEDRVVFVLLKRLGEPVIQEDVSLEMIKDVMGEVFGGRD
ncbi:MAG: 3-dehydroquinate synthase [Planctomycetes bacterium]|nr:3-dehydroquinate synthase [Planctomycetota bacterium]